MNVPGGAMHSAEEQNHTTSGVIGAAIEVYRHLGPGLLESTYLLCLCEELRLRKTSFRREVSIPIRYKGRKLAVGIESISWWAKPSRSSSSAWKPFFLFMKPSC